jgi:predicted RNA-binding protein with PIN domain
MDATPRYLVVDGHSVLFSVPDYARLHLAEPRKARHLLQNHLARLHDTSHWRVTLVYDGRRGTDDFPILAATKNPMVVIYSRQGQTADSIIERLTLQVDDPSRVSVVTADRAEQITVEAAGAEVHSPSWLVSELQRNDQIWQSFLSSALNEKTKQRHRLFD